MIKGCRADWEFLYNPLVYRAFGERKVMLYTLFDDFSYPNRFFHPFHGVNNQSTSKNLQNADNQITPYNYQITVGLNVMRDASVDSLCKSFQEGVLEKYPFSCFTRLKVNSNLLSCKGLSLVEEIKERFNEIANPKLQYYKVLYGIGFDEVILINFSNSISDLLTFVCKCRNMMRTESNAHYFTSAYSCPGYLFCASDAQEHYKFEHKDDDIEFLFSWSLKPGHLNKLDKELAHVIKKIQLNAKINISSLSYELDLSISNFKDENDKLLDLFSRISDVDWQNRHTYGVRANILMRSDDNYINDNLTPFSPEAHFSFDNKPYVFSSEAIMEIRETLDQIGISKNLKERVMKMYYNYNHKVSDCNYYFSFLSLKPFLRKFSEVISQYDKEYGDKKSFILHQWIDESVKDFEHAYYNRFHQSQRTRGLTDYNVEWNGGIQQIVLSFDNLYKKILCLLPKSSDFRFLYVSGDDRVHVGEQSYRINMNNVTYPEFFISTIWKEIFNFLILETSNNSSYTTSFFAEEHFEKHLNTIKHRLFHHLNFNPTNEIHHLFLSELNKEYLISIFADALAYSYGYCGSTNDFEYWYWANFLQAAIHHDEVDGKVNKNRFVMFLSRIMMSRKLSGQPIESMFLNPPDPSISSLWVECFRDTQKVVEALWEVLDYLNVIQIVNSYQCLLLDNIQNGSFDLITKRPELFYQLMKKCQNKIANNRKYYRNIYKEWCVPFNINWSREDFVLSYIPSYLNFVKASFFDLKPIIVLSRSKGKICLNEADKQYYSDILLDPIGGLFCINGSKQASYFSAKAILYLSMIDYYYKSDKNSNK